MLRVESTVEIDRPVEEVFAFGCEVEKLPLWMTGIIEARQTTPGPVQKGTEFEHVMHFAGKRFTSKFETIEFEENRRMAFRTISGPVDMVATMSYEDSGTGTRIHEVVEGDPRGFFKLAQPVLVKLVGRQLDASLGNMKDLLEAESQSA